MQELQISKVVHIDLVLQHYYDSISAEANRSHLRPERKFSDASILVIIPYENLVRGIHRVRPTPDESQNVASEQHLHHADPTAGEVSLERLLERVAVIDPEPSACSASKAAIILVERDGEEI
jgi:hypothetical protein